MKKRLKITTVTNELRSGSAFFQKHSSPQRSTPENPSPKSTKKETQIERNSVRKSERTEKRTVTLPYKRATKRYSFEFYTDQLAALKRLEGQAMMEGKGFNKSNFIRNALDEYFAKMDIALSESQD